MNRKIFLTALAFAAAAPSAAQEASPTIDYPAFRDLTRELEPVRAAHRLDWAQFAQRARGKGAVLLDARSESAYRRGHIKGAINLPFTDFTAERLREVLGDDPDRPIYIYCNNNFSDNRAPVALKAAPLALNIATFINLHGYGYRNVWELAGQISMQDPAVRWVGKRG